MRHIKYKLFWAWQYEKEEAWLNEMARNGMALISVGICRYEFEECTPGEYIYRIELLKSWPSQADSISYIRFLEDTGAEHVSSLLRWVYLRRKASEGPFDLYSDLSSRISYLKRVQLFFLALLFLELPIGISNLSLGIGLGNQVNVLLGMILIFISVMLVAALALQRRKIKMLKIEQSIRE